MITLEEAEVDLEVAVEEAAEADTEVADQQLKEVTEEEVIEITIENNTKMMTMTITTLNQSMLKTIEEPTKRKTLTSIKKTTPNSESEEALCTIKFLVI